MHSPASPSTALTWQKLLAPYAKADHRKAWFQFLSTSVLFAANWLLMLWSLQGPYWLTLLLALPATGMQIRLFIFQHDCGHGSFFRSRLLNDLTGAAIGVLMLTPYKYWRRTHAIHHATSGDLDRRSFGDVGTLTVAEYQQLSWLGKLGYRLYRNPLLLLTVGPVYQFVLKHRLPVDIPLSWKREWRSVMGTNLSIAIVLTVAWFTIGIKSFLLVQAPITILSAALGMWLFYVQHQFEDTYWRENPDWDFHEAGLQGSSFYDLPKVLHWFTGNIGYHHIHHMASRIPNYHLPRCFREVPEVQRVTRLKILESLPCAWLALWDSEQSKLVTFREARRTAAT